MAGGGGSQLSELKKTLRDSGLSRTSKPRDLKKQHAQRRRSAGGATAGDHRRAQLAGVAERFNAFDTRDVRQKFDVVSSSRTGAHAHAGGGARATTRTVRPGVSRQRGLEARREALLPLLERRAHASEFIDRRFGENDERLSADDRALARFTAEREQRLLGGGGGSSSATTARAAGGGSKAKRASRFNLADDDDDEASDFLTHGGRKLGFGDEDELGTETLGRSDQDRGWGGGLGTGEAPPVRISDLVHKRRAADPDDDEVISDEDDQGRPRKRTRQEIMDEVVAKSKAHKAERQKLRAEDDETRMALDDELKHLRSLLKTPRASADTHKGKQRASAASSGSAPESDEAESDQEASEGEGKGKSDAEAEQEDEEEEEEQELDEQGFDQALAKAGKSAVDRDLLRKLIGGGDASSDDDEVDDDDDDDEDEQGVQVQGDDDDGERPPPAPQDADERDPYDTYVRMLTLEPRAKPTDRLKTPAELAQAAAKELAEREAKRLKRQRGERDDEGADSDDDDDEGQGNKRVRTGAATAKSRIPVADDLEDDYLLEGVNDGEGEDAAAGTWRPGDLGAGLKDAASSSDESDAGSEEEDSQSFDSSDAELVVVDEAPDGADVADDSEEDESVASEPDDIVAPLDVDDGDEAADRERQGAGELPYTFECPQTHAEFVTLLRNSNVAERDTPTVVKRIRTLYHPGLGEQNKAKLQAFTCVLLDHVLHLAEANPTSETFDTVNALLPHLITLCFAFPLTTAPHFVDKLVMMQRNLTKGLSHGAHDPKARTWPRLPELVLLRVIGFVWSTSDLSHPVAAPALLLISQYLSQARLRSTSDLASGLFLVTVALQYEQLSRRYVPEVVDFLANALAATLPLSKAGNAFTDPAPVFEVDAANAKRLRLRSTADLTPQTLNAIELLKQGGGGHQAKVDLVDASLKLVQKLAAQVVSLEAFVEVFSPIKALLDSVSTSKLPRAITNTLGRVQADLARMLKLSLSGRKPLTMQQHRPIPIPTYVPKFDEGFNPNQKFDPDSSRAEASKLRAQYRKERKGAIRELRRDNQFLATEQQRRRKQEDTEYSKKISGIMSGLQNERAEEKAHERFKAGAKRRDRARSGRGR